MPGGLPNYTYNPRDERSLEKGIRESSFDTNKLVMVTGMTKSGKSVLTQRVFNKATSIWCDCGSFDSEAELWDFIMHKLNAFNSITRSKSTTRTREFSGKIRTGPFGIFSFFEGLFKGDRQKQKGLQQSRTITSKSVAIDILKEQKIPLVLDDFHYLDRKVQGNIVRGLKAPIFSGLPVVFIAIPHRRLDAVKVEREMTGRVDNIQIPVWDEDELKEIANKGFPLLRMRVEEEIINHFAGESFGSPHLMQEFCLDFALKYGDKQSLRREKSFEYNKEEVEETLKRVAKTTGKVVYDKLAKGPRQRSDRIRRPLKEGGEVDIYEAILLALVQMKPGLSTIEYEELRDSLRTVLSDKIPNSQEVSRVLSKMSEVALDDESSTPVIDWEKEEGKLHITDPFFAFYLRWGV